MGQLMAHLRNAVSQASMLETSTQVLTARLQASQTDMARHLLDLVNIQTQMQQRLRILQEKQRTLGQFPDEWKQALATLPMTRPE